MALAPLVDWIRDGYKNMEAGTSRVALGVGKIASKTPRQGKPPQVESAEPGIFFFPMIVNVISPF